MGVDGAQLGKCYVECQPIEIGLNKKTRMRKSKDL